MNLIEAQELSFSFGTNKVLESVSFSIAQGEVVAIIGPSGAGKTSLLKLLCGLLSPQNGRVLVKQRNLSTLSAKDRTLWNSEVGILFQKNALFDSMTCLENILFPLKEASNLAETERHHLAVTLLEAVGLSHAQGLHPHEISGGMQKRLGIARALALSPKIIFYDDPTAGLDPITSKKIIDLIRSFQKKENSTVVMVTNDMNRAYQIADRILMVVDHSVLEAGTIESIQKNKDPRVIQFIHGRSEGPLTELLTTT